MKKIISLFLVISTVMLAFASCGASATTGTTASTSQTAAPTTANTGTTATTEGTTATTNPTTATTATTAKPQEPSAEPKLIFHLDFSPESLKDGKYTDLTGNGHDGVVHGSVENEGGSAKFVGDGTSYISIADHEDLNFTGAQSFTLEVRFKADPQSRWACIAQKGLGDDSGAYFGFWLDSGNKLNMGAAMVGAKNYASDAVVGTEWHQAIIIQDAKAGTILFYLDGELQGSTFPKNNKIPAEPMFLSSKGEEFTIGTNFSDHYTGLIDDIKLYNYAVSEKELLKDYPGQVFTLEREYYEYSDAQTGESFTLPYRIYYPTGYTENNGTKYPVVLMMHGHGECGKDNVAHLRNNGGHIEGLMARDDCIIIAPQCQCDNGVNKEWVASNHRFDLTNRTLDEKGTVALRALMALM
ncbi:MAG: hypothetical protein IJW21_01575, partial [Clostridia bacterium]|nr:hypothetical protein [Clostridia bacterium]